MENMGAEKSEGQQKCYTQAGYRNRAALKLLQNPNKSARRDSYTQNGNFTVSGGV